MAHSLTQTKNDLRQSSLLFIAESQYIPRCSIRRYSYQMSMTKRKHWLDAIYLWRAMGYLLWIPQTNMAATCLKNALYSTSTVPLGVTKVSHTLSYFAIPCLCVPTTIVTGHLGICRILVFQNIIYLQLQCSLLRCQFRRDSLHHSDKLLLLEWNRQL